MKKDPQNMNESVVAPPQTQQNQGPFFKPQTAFGAGSGIATPVGGQGAQPLQVGQGGPAAAGPKTGGPAAAAPVAAPPVVDMDTERRTYIDNLKDYINTAAQGMRFMKVDGSMLDKLLKSWMVMYAKGEDIISKIGSDTGGGTSGVDAISSAGPGPQNIILLRSLQKTFASAIRSLFLQASVTTKRPLIRLYMENSSSLPDWAWPDSGLFTGGNDKEKRSFAADFATALRDAALFDAYGAMDRSKLEQILGRLNKLVDDTEIMIAGQLNNDADVRKDVQTAYGGAVKRLLSAAAVPLKTSLFRLYMDYRFGPKTQLIHEWADEQAQFINAPIPQGTGGADPLTGDVTFSLNGFTVIIKPDGPKAGTGGSAETRADPDPQFVTPGFDAPSGLITRIDPVSPPVIIIQSFFQQDAVRSGDSGYGRGTTDEDKKRGNTSLSYHEGSHAKDFLSFINANPAPVFGGRIGQTKLAFHSAVTAWQRALNSYFATMGKTSERLTDCVGKPTIEEYYRAQGTVPSVRCR